MYVANIERVRFVNALTDACAARAALVANAERIEASIADAYVRGSDVWRMSEKHMPQQLRNSARMVYGDLLLLRLQAAGFCARWSAATCAQCPQCTHCTLEITNLGGFNCFFHL